MREGGRRRRRGGRHAAAGHRSPLPFSSSSSRSGLTPPLWEGVGCGTPLPNPPQPPPSEQTPSRKYLWGKGRREGSPPAHSEEGALHQPPLHRPNIKVPPPTPRCPALTSFTPASGCWKRREGGERGVGGAVPWRGMGRGGNKGERRGGRGARAAATAPRRETEPGGAPSPRSPHCAHLHSGDVIGGGARAGKKGGARARASLVPRVPQPRATAPCDSPLQI